MNHSIRIRLPLIIVIILVSAALTNAAYAANVRSERLWLPASATHLRPFLQMAVDLALTDENCTDVLYARMNEYRTIYDEPTFTILCKRDAKSTFNRVVPITEVDPDYFAKIQASDEALDTAQTLSPEIEAIRQQLVRSPAPARTPTAVPAPTVQEDPDDMTLDLSTPAAAEH